MEKIKWSEKVTNEQVLDRIGEKRILLNNILHRKANWIGHIMRRNCLLHDVMMLAHFQLRPPDEPLGQARTFLLLDPR